MPSSHVPPEFWPHVWGRIADGAAPHVVGWQPGWGPCPLSDGPGPGLAAFDVDGTTTVDASALGDGAPFLVATPRWSFANLASFDVESFRGVLSQRFGATVHLLDPDPGSPWLLAFGWKGRRVEPRRRALLVTHVNALRIFGGGETQLFETLTFLRGEGVVADVSIALRLSPDRYDVVHAFSAYHGPNLEALFALQRPLVISPIFLDYSEMTYEGQVSAAILGQDDPSRVERLLGVRRDGKLTVDGASRRAIAEPVELRWQQRALFERADRLLLLSEREGRMIDDVVGQVHTPRALVPNAVRPESFAEATPDAFVERFGIRDFVLCAGRIEPPKNQALLVWALRKTGLPIVLAGRAADGAYAELCRRVAGAPVHLVGALPPDLMASAYAAARVHALPSWGEVVGLATLEAALAGCSLVVSNRGGEAEYMGELAHVCDPADADGIRDAVLSAWDDVAPERRAARKRHVLGRYTWDETARAIARVYGEITAAGDALLLAPTWTRPETWEPVLRWYLQAHRPGSGALLRLYAGPLNHAAPGVVLEDVSRFLTAAGVDPDACADLEIVDELPGDPSTKAVLSGSDLDGVLRGRYGDRCVTASSLG